MKTHLALLLPLGLAAAALGAPTPTPGTLAPSPAVPGASIRLSRRPPAAPGTVTYTNAAAMRSNPLAPGVYESSPSKCLIVVPAPAIDDQSLIQPKNVPSMPVMVPDLQLIPRRAAATPKRPPAATK